MPVPSQNASIGKRQVILLKAEQVIRETANLCRDFGAKEVILYGSRAKETARERSDIDIAVTGVKDFDALVEEVENLPTLYSVDMVNMDTCKNQLLLEDIRQNIIAGLHHFVIRWMHYRRQRTETFLIHLC